MNPIGQTFPVIHMHLVGNSEQNSKDFFPPVWDSEGLDAFRFFFKHTCSRLLKPRYNTHKRYGYYFKVKYGSIGYGCQACSWSAEQEKSCFACPRSRLRVCSRETGSAVPSRVSLLILHTQPESGAYLRGSSRVPRQRPFIYLNHHTPSGQSRVYRVTQVRTDGVHCRESIGARPVVLKLD